MRISGCLECSLGSGAAEECAQLGGHSTAGSLRNFESCVCSRPHLSLAIDSSAPPHAALVPGDTLCSWPGHVTVTCGPHATADSPAPGLVWQTHKQALAFSKATASCTSTPHCAPTLPTPTLNHESNAVPPTYWSTWHSLQKPHIRSMNPQRLFRAARPHPRRACIPAVPPPPPVRPPPPAWPPRRTRAPRPRCRRGAQRTALHHGPMAASWALTAAPGRRCWALQ